MKRLAEVVARSWGGVTVRWKRRTGNGRGKGRTVISDIDDCDIFFDIETVRSLLE
jgi:hypothetical protein